jgi:hypothetical protein
VRISANSVSVTPWEHEIRFPRVANYFILNIRDGKPFKRLEVGAQGSKICLKPEGSKVQLLDEASNFVVYYQY